MESLLSRALCAWVDAVRRSARLVVVVTAVMTLALFAYTSTQGVGVDHHQQGFIQYGKGLGELVVGLPSIRPSGSYCWRRSALRRLRLF